MPPAPRRWGGVVKGRALVLASRDITRLEDCGVVEAGAEVHKEVEH